MITADKNTEPLVTEIGDIQLRNGILEILIGQNMSIELRDVERMIEPIESVTKGQKYPVLLDTGRNNRVSSSARQYIADRFQRFRTAEAIVCTTFYHRLLAQLYMSINKPSNPVKVFANRDDARLWLSENFV